MTRVDLAAPPSLLADKSGNGGRRAEASGSFDEADAGFLQQLATVAADGDTSGCIPRSQDSGEAAIAHWSQRQAGTEALQAPRPDRCGEQIAQVTNVLVAGIDAEATILAAPAVDPRPGDDPDPDPQAGDGPDPQAKDAAVYIGDIGLMARAAPVMPTAIPVAAAAPRTLPVTPIDPRQRPAQAEPLPRVSKDAATQAIPRPVDVKVVGSETHLAPALRLAPMPQASKPVLAERAGTADSRKSDQPAENTKPVRLVPTVRGQSTEQSLTKGASDQANADTSDPGANNESAAPAVTLSARGVAQAMQSAASPAQQIADKIDAELSPAETDGSRAAPVTTPRPASLQPVKVLTIQLHPVDLGTVTVRMTLKADVMDVQVEVGRRSTARLIDADRDTLTSLLRSAGYNVEGLTVRAVESANAASAPGPTQGAPDSGPQLQPGGSQPDARASGGRSQPEPRNHQQVPDRNNNDSDQASGDRRGAGLYV